MLSMQLQAAGLLVSLYAANLAGAEPPILSLLSETIATNSPDGEPYRVRIYGNGQTSIIIYLAFDTLKPVKAIKASNLTCSPIDIPNLKITRKMVIFRHITYQFKAKLNTGPIVSHPDPIPPLPLQGEPHK